MRIRQNLHIHSHHSCDSACATLDDIQKEMLQYGMTEFGVSDHLHTHYNFCDVTGARNDFLCAGRPEAFHFGIEVSSVSEWECQKIAAGDYERIGDDPVYGLRFARGPEENKVVIGITEEEIRLCGIEYVIAGVHWPLYTRPDRESATWDYFHQMISLLQNPLVTILAHPWDSLEMAAGGFFQSRDAKDVDYDALTEIPPELNEKLMLELLKYNKAAELNLAVLNSPSLPEKCRKAYWKTFAQWREAGVQFTIGSDQHGPHAVPALFAASELLLDCYGFREENIRYLFE